jgi:anti-anti-sigma factor
MNDDPRLQLFLRVLDAAPIVMFALDATGHFTMSAGKGLADLGTKPGEWVGRNGLEDWKGTEAEGAMRRALTGEEFKTSLSIPGPRHYDVWYLPLRDANGALTGTLGLAVDVTLERERELEIRKQLETVQQQQAKIEMFNRAVNAAPVTLWMLDHTGKILMSEGGILSKMGLRPGESVGSNALDMYRGSPMEDVVHQTLSGASRTAPSQEVAPGLFLDTWCVPIAEADGATGVLGLSIDSSERVRTEREIRDKLAVIERQAATIKALATPIIRVWDEVLCLPVIGTVDSQRTAEMMSSLLHAIAREQARYAIVDLTGVDVVDTSTADHLIRLFKAARVLGVEGVLCGIQPAVAQTVVALGMDLGEVHTKRTLQDALKWCLARRSALGEVSRNGVGHAPVVAR